MKHLIRVLCLAGVVAGINLNAQIPTSDDFTTEMRWQAINNPPKIPAGGGATSFTTTTGQMDYLVNSASAKDAAGRVWGPSVAPTDTDWTVDVFVNLSSAVNANLGTGGQYVNLNLGVAFSTYSMMVSIDRYNNGSGLVYGFEAYNGNTTLSGAYEDTTDLLTTGRLRLAYTSASGGTLTAQFSNNAIAAGAYQTVGTLNNVTGTWGMSASDTFNIILVGGSGQSPGTTGPTIAANQAYFDNFASSGLEARTTPVPEPSTYAAILGALALGFALYRRRN